MKKNISRFIMFILVIIIIPFHIEDCYGYTDTDLPYEDNKNFVLSIDDYNSEDVNKLYNPDNTSVPSSFSLKNKLSSQYNINLSAENQLVLNLCEAFASLKSIETNYALKTGRLINLSERYIDYMLSKYMYGQSRIMGILPNIFNANSSNNNESYSSGDGVAIDQVYTFLETFGGATEYDIPLKNYTDSEYNNFINIEPVLKLNSSIAFPNIDKNNLTNETTRNKWLKIIKIHLMKYGSLRTAIGSPNGANTYNEATAAYYYKSGLTGMGGGHAVSIVGWDDNYSKNNFLVKPEHDGAFIVLNSWGNSWGDDGYFYISYDSYGYLEQLIGAIDVSLARDYKTYTYAQKMFVTTGILHSTTSSRLFKSYGLKFTKGNDTEYLSHITALLGTYYDHDSTDKIRYYINPIDDSFDKDKMIYLGRVSSIIGGFKTNVTLNEPIALTGNSFAVVFEFECENRKCGFSDSKDSNNETISGNMYNSNGFTNEEWNKIDYEFPVFVLTAKKDISNVSVTKLPNKTAFNKGEKLDLTGGTLKVKYGDDPETTVSMASNLVRVIGYNQTKAGNQSITITYDGAVANFNVYINDISSIEVDKLPNKVVYSSGDAVDLTGGQIKVIFEGGGTKIVPMTSVDVDIVSIAQVNNNTQKITISYDGKTTSFNVLVKQVASWQKVVFPTKKEYNQGEALDLTGGVITVLYNDGTTQNIPMTSSDVKVTGYNPNKLGTQTITVSYGGKSATYTVTVKELKFVVSFNSNGGSSVQSQTIVNNGKVTKPNNPTRVGYTFKEWQLNNKKYDFNTPVTSNITLVALWIKNETQTTTTLKEILIKNGYDVIDNYVYNFTLGDTIVNINNKLGKDITFDTKTTIISTGTIIKRGNESYTVVIKGDLSGDGKINSSDLLQMRNYLLEVNSLSGAYKKAGMIDSSNDIKSLDLLRLRQYLLGDYKLSQKGV